MLTRPRLYLAVSALIVAGLLSSCSSSEPGTSSPAASAPVPAPTSSPAVDLSAYLLTIDDLTTGGWTQTPDAGSSEPPTSQDAPSTDPCEGDLSSVIDIPDADSAPTASFERDGATVSQTVLLSDGPALVEQIRNAVEPCYGKQTEVTTDGQTAMVEYTAVSLPETLAGAYAFDFTRSVSVVSATVHVIVFPAGEYAEAMTGVGSFSSAIDADEFQGFALAAIAKAQQ
jgi:hypothetical protein